MGPLAKALGPLARGYAQFGRRTRTGQLASGSAPGQSGYSLNNRLSAAFPARLASVMDSK